MRLNYCFFGPMVRVLTLLVLLQPTYKVPLQRLMLNLSAHAEARIALVKIFMDLLMLDVGQPATDLNTAEPPYRLYGCQSNVMYSRPQHLDGKTVSSCSTF